jgi:serine/threonine-protein kinase/endoribonuclease IRE1
MALIFCLSALLFVLGLFAKCFSELISLKGHQQDCTDVIAKRSKLPFGYRFLSPIHGAKPNTELSLLDVVLLASVDGKFHALNRTSGQLLWSMASSTSPSAQNVVPPALGPLVRTAHVEYDPELTDDDSPDQELYIVEPQSGDIYVMSSPGSPLQRLSLSMSQLVDASPFSFYGDETRFVGKKETTLLLLELETGRLKASLNTECPWDQFEDMHPDVGQDIDELEGHTERSAPTEIYIGRTGKHIFVNLQNTITLHEL